MASTEEQIAEIVDECEHGSTAAFCAVCKRDNPTAEYVARQRRRADRDAWDTEGRDITSGTAGTGTGRRPNFPYVEAKYPSTCDCGDGIEPGDTIFKVEDEWSCWPCAEVAETLGSNG